MDIELWNEKSRKETFIFMEYTKYFRVQNGTGFSKSREMLSVSSSNTLQLQSLRKKVHIGSEQHNRNFIPLRLSEKVQKYAGQDISQGKVDVIVMYFPNFFGNLLKKCAISEYIKTGDDVKAPPHTEDVNNGEAYAVYGTWNAIMEACCVYAENIHICSLEEAEQTLYNSQEPPKRNQINIQKLENFLNHASEKSPIGPNDIKKIINESSKFNREIELERDIEIGEKIK